MELTDAHLDELDQRGFIILPGFRHGEELKAMQQAQRCVLPSWDEVKDDPPPGRAILTEFPPPKWRCCAASSIIKLGTSPGSGLAASISTSAPVA